MRRSSLMLFRHYEVSGVKPRPTTDAQTINIYKLIYYIRILQLIIFLPGSYVRGKPTSVGFFCLIYLGVSPRRVTVAFNTVTASMHLGAGALLLTQAIFSRRELIKALVCEAFSWIISGQEEISRDISFSASKYITLVT